MAMATKVGEVYADYKGELHYVYGWPTSDFAFTSRQDAERAWKLANQYAREQCEDLASKVRDVLP